MKKEPSEDLQNVISMTTGISAIKVKTDRLMADICKQVAESNVPIEAASMVLITLGFSMLYHMTRVDKQMAMDAAKSAVDAVYNGD